MADTENMDNPTKRKLDPFPTSKYNSGQEEEEEENQNKYQKLQVLPQKDISVPNGEKSTGNLTQEPSNINSRSNFEKSVSKAQAEENAGAEVAEEEEEEEEDADFEDEEEEENGEAVAVDRKGKGKMIEEERDDSDEDDDDNSSDVDSDCNEEELDDDPLAEVDLDNILPSRTRRRAVQPGVYIANDLVNNKDDDDSDSSDA